MATNRAYEVKEVGIFRPQQPKFFVQDKLQAGDIGYVIANIKASSEVKVGDTLTSGRTPAATYAARTHAATVAGHRDRWARLAGLGVSTVFLATPDLDRPEDVLDLAGLNA